MKDTYFAKAVKKSREKKKAIILNLRERNDFLEKNMPKLKRKRDCLIQEYDLLQRNNYITKNEMDQKSNNNAILKDEILFYRRYQNRMFDLIQNLQQQTKLESNTFQVRRNFYQLLSSVSRMSLKSSKKPKKILMTSYSMRGITKKLQYNIFYEEKRINDRLQRIMTIDINHIPINFIRLAHIWHKLQEDKTFMLMLGKKLSSGKSFSKLFSNIGSMEDDKPILSNTEFTLTSNKSDSKFYKLTGMHKNESETTIVKTFLPDYSRNLEELKEDNPFMIKATKFKKGADKDDALLTAFFSFEDATLKNNSFSKDCFFDFIRQTNAVERNIFLIKSILHQCLHVAG